MTPTQLDYEQRIREVAAEFGIPRGDIWIDCDAFGVNVSFRRRGTAILPMEYTPHEDILREWFRHTLGIKPKGDDAVTHRWTLEMMRMDDE